MLKVIFFKKLLSNTCIILILDYLSKNLKLVNKLFTK